MREYREHFEHTVQSQLLTWWRGEAIKRGLDERCLIVTGPDAVLREVFLTPASEKRVLAAICENGYRRGCPDLLLMLSTPHAGFLAIELKAAHGEASAAQIEMAKVLVQCGGAFACCHGFAEARDAILEHLNGYKKQEQVFIFQQYLNRKQRMNRLKQQLEDLKASHAEEIRGMSAQLEELKTKLLCMQSKVDTLQRRNNYLEEHNNSLFEEGKMA